LPDPSALEYAFLGVAALAGGAVNAVAGGGSLISFPALLAVGYPAVDANVTNSVALLPGYAGGTAAYRPELAGQRRRAIALGINCAAGSAAGTALLLTVSRSTFDAIVPFLVLLACGLLAAQPMLNRVVSQHRGHGSVPLHLAVFAGAVYGGYFGAGLGIMLLALLAAFIADDLQRLNALKGLLSLVVSFVAAAGFALFGPVAWVAALIMAACSVVGGYLGVGLARRLDDRALRWAVVAYGVVVAVILFVT
jgi:uncharacterized membrane protein YfcA